MIAREKYRETVEKAARMLDRAGLAITPAERERFEVADFGLGEVERTGLEIITYVNTERVCAKEIVMLPDQKSTGGREQMRKYNYADCPCAEDGVRREHY